MADRILVWHNPVKDDQRKYYMEREYAPTHLRIMAENPPTSGDLIIDILEDGESIMHRSLITVQDMTKTNGRIEYNTLATSTFAVDEIIEGGTSSAYGAVVTDNKIGSMTVIHTSPTTPFVADETITGLTSGATAVVTSWVAPQEYLTPSRKTLEPDSKLKQGESLNEEAEDFDIEKPNLNEGSVISIDVIRSGGASGVTVQLELEESGVV